MPPDRISWKETRRRLRQDRRRLVELLAERRTKKPLFLILHPSYLCIWLHRVSHYWCRRGWGKLSRLFWQLNLLLTAADIHPESDLKGGLLIPHPAAVTMAANAGCNLTIMAMAGAGGLLPKQNDLGAGPGHPVLGDDVHMSPHCAILGPVRIGNRVHIAPGCFVTRDVPDDASVHGPPVKFLERAASK